MTLHIFTAEEGGGDGDKTRRKMKERGTAQEGGGLVQTSEGQLIFHKSRLERSWNEERGMWRRRKTAGFFRSQTSVPEPSSAR